MKEYGRKPYMGKSYYEMIRRPSKKHLQNIKLQKESEFEKPYLKDEYPEMQHFAPVSEPPPGSPDDPGSPEWPLFPTLPPGSSWPPYPPGPPGDPGSPYPPGDPWWPDEPPTPGNTTCPPNMECNPRNSGQVDADGCGLVFVGGMCGTAIAARLLARSDSGFKIRGSGNNFDCQHCQPSFFVKVCYEGSDSDATAYIEFVDTQFSDQGGASVICEIKANCCTLATQISYSSGNPATIGQSTEAVITVDDGCGPFSWSVSGTGYSFAQPKTASRSNTLITDGSACGTGTITVTDDCGDTATGYVRGTAGQWVLKSATCGLTAAGEATETALGGGDLGYEYIKGYQKQTHNCLYKGTTNFINCAGHDCVGGHCADPPGIECVSCLDWDAEYGVSRVPCVDAPIEGKPDRSICWINAAYLYHEWEC